MLPEHAPFSPDLRRALDGLLGGLSPIQRVWLGGYLSAGDGLPSPGGAGAAAPAVATKLTILYGSESGNAEKLADQSAKEAKKRGFAATVKNLADLTPADMAKMENVLIIVSTWGDGDPPETASSFYKTFMAEALTLPKLRYSVCGLGDTAYEKFCQMGKDFDTKLEVYGGKRVHARQDCDVEYEKPYKTWLDAALSAFGPATAASSASAPDLAAYSFAPAAAAVEYSKSHPFHAELKERVLLNGKGSAKETLHYEFSLEGSALTYEPGDSLGIVPTNAPDEVEYLLKMAKHKGDEEVEVTDIGTKTLAEALRADFDITALTRPILTKLQALTKNKKLAALLAEGAEAKLKEYLYGRSIADALADYAPKGLSTADLVSLFRKLPPRLYSIASSLLAHPDEVHLTVASVRYEANGRQRKGVASTYLADLLQKGDKAPVYVNQNKQFRLPAAADTPIIMVGPGTGVAPFRAFVEHRAELGRHGKSWLFFGDQRYTYDFLYQVEWQEHLANKSLTRLDVAFSRDQPEKIYVQHKMAERSKVLYSWLQDGAHFYVCGDANRMAHDVHEALIGVVAKEGALSREAAEAYVEDLKKTKRYQRDVY